jgi:dTDP-4-amino-4,6-dideoxygalactose transaminase
MPTPGAKETTRTVQLPVYESLTDEQRDRVASVVTEAVLSTPAVDPAALHQS